jgi:predicted negative regulator of RcsB-dependent stress response
VSDYLSDDEQLARLRQWWQRNGVSLVAGVVVIVAGVIGWQWYQSSVAERIARASDLYMEFLAADGDARAVLADAIAREGRSTAYPALVLLNRARDAVGDGDAEAAAVHLAEAVRVARGRMLADLARLRLAHLELELGRDDAALATLSEIRSAGYRAVALELKGDIHLARGERALAYQSYSAALAEALSEDQRPLLEVKVADTADARDS